MLEDTERPVLTVVVVGIVMNPYQNPTCLRPCINDYFSSERGFA